MSSCCFALPSVLLDRPDQRRSDSRVDRLFLPYLLTLRHSFHNIPCSYPRPRDLVCRPCPGNVGIDTELSISNSRQRGQTQKSRHLRIGQRKPRTSPGIVPLPVALLHNFARGSQSLSLSTKYTVPSVWGCRTPETNRNSNHHMNHLHSSSRHTLLCRAHSSVLRLHPGVEKTWERKM